MGVLYLGLNFGNSILSNCLSKYKSNLFRKQTFIGTILTSIVSGIIAMLFFSILCKFNYSGINTRTILYTIYFTFGCYFSYVTSILIYNYLSIIDYMLISAPLGLIGNVLYSVLLFNEPLNTQTIISILIRSVAVFVSFLNVKKSTVLTEEQKEQKRQDRAKFKKGVILTLIITGWSIISGIVNKFYAIDLDEHRVANQNVYFFLVNVFIFVVAVVICIVSLIFKREKFIANIKAVNKKAIPVLVVQTISSNIGSTINVILTVLFPILVLTPLSGSISMIAAIIASLIFKEKITFFRVLALILTVVAAVVMVVPF